MGEKRLRFILYMRKPVWSALLVSRGLFSSCILDNFATSQESVTMGAEFGAVSSSPLVHTIALMPMACWFCDSATLLEVLKENFKEALFVLGSHQPTHIDSCKEAKRGKEHDLY